MVIVLTPQVLMIARLRRSIGVKLDTILRFFKDRAYALHAEQLKAVGSFASCFYAFT
jgi:hypothetical protein